MRLENTHVEVSSSWLQTLSKLNVTAHCGLTYCPDRVFMSLYSAQQQQQCLVSEIRACFRPSYCHLALNPLIWPSILLEPLASCHVCRVCPVWHLCPEPSVLMEPYIVSDLSVLNPLSCLSYMSCLTCLTWALFLIAPSEESITKHAAFNEFIRLFLSLSLTFPESFDFSWVFHLTFAEPESSSLWVINHEQSRSLCVRTSLLFFPCKIEHMIVSHSWFCLKIESIDDTIDWYDDTVDWYYRLSIDDDSIDWYYRLIWWYYWYFRLMILC